MLVAAAVVLKSKHTILETGSSVAMKREALASKGQGGKGKWGYIAKLAPLDRRLLPSSRQ